MTIQEAISANLYPYDVEPNLMEKACVDCGLNGSSEYDIACQVNVANATISILQNLIVLSSESDSGFSLSYNTENLKERIFAIAKQHGLADIAEEYNHKACSAALSAAWIFAICSL